MSDDLKNRTDSSAAREGKDPETGATGPSLAPDWNNAMPVGLFTATTEGRLLDVNTALAILLGV